MEWAGDEDTALITAKMLAQVRKIKCVRVRVCGPCVSVRARASFGRACAVLGVGRTCVQSGAYIGSVRVSGGAACARVVVCVCATVCACVGACGRLRVCV